jgi:hypothetical protein
VLAVALVAAHGCRAGTPDAGPAAVARTDERVATPASARTTVDPTVTAAPAPATTVATTTAVVATAPAPTAPTAPAAAAATPVTLPTLEQLGAAAVRLVKFDLARLPGWQIAFLAGRPGLQGQTFPDRRRIEVYVAAQDGTRAISYNLAHEVGHAVDLTYSTRASRLAFRAIRRIPAATLWFGCGGCTDFATPSGDFAESFGLIVTDAAYDWRSQMGPRPTADERAAIVALYHL